MSALAKAHMQALGADDSVLNEFDVQFNPASLKLQLSNSLEGGTTQGAQARQNAGTGSSTLTFELTFDTADEGSDGSPRSVREKTAQIEQFLLPRGKDEGKEAPPRVGFQWGDLIVTGVMEGLTLDMDFFSPEGVPLRAKMGVTIKGQDKRLELPEAGAPGPAPGESKGAPGTSGSGGAQSAAALAGESAADFAARVGLDPSAWRGLSAGLEGTLSLEAGVEIGFSAGLSGGIGLGATIGVEAGVGASLEASFGLDASAGASLGGSFGASLGVGLSASAGAGLSLGGGASASASVTGGLRSAASAEVAAGFALSSAGGFEAAVETVRTVRAEAAASHARASFSTPAPAPPPRLTAGGGAGRAGAAATTTVARVATAAAPVVSGPARPDQPRPRLNAPRATPPPAPAPAPRPPRADPRAVSFGFGVPLRPRAEVPPDGPAVDGVVVLRPKASASLSAGRPDPTAAPWTYLPADRDARPGAPRSGGCGCGCNAGGPGRTRGKR